MSTSPGILRESGELGTGRFLLQEISTKFLHASEIRYWRLYIKNCSKHNITEMLLLGIMERFEQIVSVYLGFQSSILRFPGDSSQILFQNT